jgi:P4 family phage/plasmid primase-like protien
MSYKKEQLKPYFEFKSELIPLHVWNKQINGDERGKTPRDREWNSKEYGQDKSTYLSWIKSGYNIGYRIKENELIVDLDPRNYTKGIDSEELIADLFGFFDFEELTWELPVVKTGGGGYHIYCTLPYDVDYRCLRKCVENLPGVDFKKKGGYVVAAGSKHPSGDQYSWINEAERPLVPNDLLDLIKRDKFETKDYTSGYGAFTGTQLQGLVLDKLDISDFDSNDNWEPLMMECHHATAGEGIEEFLDWSLSDSKYSDDENKIRNRWESLDDTKEATRTAASLIHRLKGSGEDTKHVKAILDFGTLPDFSEMDEQDDLESDLLSKAKKVGQETTSADVFNVDTHEYSDREGLAVAMARDLGPNPNKEELMKCLRVIKVADIVEREEALAEITISTKKKYTRATLNRILKDIDGTVTKDLATTLSNKALEDVFNNKRHILIEPNESVWVYNRTHWEQISNKYLEKVIRHTLNGLAQNMEINTDEMTLIKKATELTKMEAATNTSKLHKTDAPDPIISCKNCEIHINKDGTHTVKDHSYRSYSTRCLNTEYDPSAKAPLFMQTLREIFSGFDDTEDMVRHIGEVFGYIIQPYKNLSSWWLFIGPGGDGKTTLADILQGVLGSAFTPGNTALINSKISNNDNHSMMGLVGALALVIGDFKKGAVIDDEKIKEYADNKVMQANPKGKDRFNFMYSAGLIVCSNHLPKTTDNSHGFARRVNVVPFNAQFTRNNTQDSDRKAKILNNPEEIAGILNFMLEGLQRLRTRGRFDIPQSCKVASEDWLSQTNNTSKFVNDCVDLTGNTEDSIGDLGSLHSMIYAGWCSDNDIDDQYRLGKLSFKEKLMELGLTIRKGGGNVVKVYGGTLKDSLTDW